MRNPLRVLFDNVTRKSTTLDELIASYLRETPTGVVSEEHALRIATFNACVRLISATVGSLPLHVYRRRDDGGKEPQRDNSLELVLNRPNAWQDPLAFREQLTSHLFFRGNGYAWGNWVQVVDRAGQRRDRVIELIPMHPDRVEVEQDDWNRPPRYYLHPKVGPRVELPADEVFHLRGWSTNGYLGRSFLADARETLGVALDTQRYASRMFVNDATPGVVLKHPKTLKDDVARRLRESWDEAHAGPRNARRTAVLEEGMTIERLTLTATDSQFLETRQFQRTDICGLFPVPPHLIGIVEKSTSWGTGIEQQMIGFLVYSIRPVLVRWEQAIRRQLVEADATYFAEHTVEGLLRGDQKSRYGAYAVGRQWGWLSVNDIRTFENMNPIENGDVYLQPLNMAEAGTVDLSDDDRRLAEDAA